ncbi:MAG TPA: tetratricopeptide repeat protein [Vicinamibacteria bacterium]|nr:tetratricopeptide repeat protein [Vicinamibacteria bacterium]
MRQALAALILLLPVKALGQEAAGGQRVIDVRSVRPEGAGSFERLWAEYQKAAARGDTDGRDKAMREIRRLRIERNIGGLEDLALGRVAEGLEKVDRGEPAEEDFRDAIALDPHLPDGYFGLALSKIKKGPGGFVTALPDVISGVTARLPTARGQYYVTTLLIPALLLTLLATVTVISIALLVRYGALLRHDIEEHVGPSRPRALSLAVFIVLLLLPLITFQGYAWLPLWWLALVFIYLKPVEKGLAAALLVLGLVVTPLANLVEASVKAQQNPLYRAGIAAVEGGPDQRAVADLEEASKKDPEDRDLAYMLATLYKKSGRYDEAAQMYRAMLAAQPDDVVALNNLGNVELAHGEVEAAIARYKKAIEANPPPDMEGTLYYNLSIAQYQKFDYQGAQESRSNAERLASGLIHSYDSLWKYEGTGLGAVVDLRLDRDQLWAKFGGMNEGTREKNVAGRSVPGIGRAVLFRGAVNRFLGFLVIFALLVFNFARWRGPRSFTLRCLKCGTPFCRRCHLGAAGQLCSQCHHLFIVRDGVSGAARNQKLLEVQKEEVRRDRVFRVLSLLLPGAGHVYAHKTLLGFALVFVWFAVLALALLAGLVVPVTEAPGTVSRPWGFGLAALLLVATYVAANWKRPQFEVALPMPRSAARRPRAAASAKAS